MAAPTVWGFTGVAGTTTTFPIEGTNLYGVDIAGTLAPKVCRIDPNTYVLTTATKTDDELVTAMKEFINRSGVRVGGEAGGRIVQGTKQAAATLTTTS